LLMSNLLVTPYEPKIASTGILVVSPGYSTGTASYDE